MTAPTCRATKPASDWRTSAACQGVDLDTLFSDQTRTQERVQSICRRCPVRAICLTDAVAYEVDSYRWGVVGGLTTVQRRALRCEALLGNQPNLKQARELASPAWASRMMPLRQRGLSPQEIAVELRGHRLLVSPVTVRLAVWWAGGKGSVMPRRGHGDTRQLWELVRDECRDIVVRLRGLEVGVRDIAAYLQVSEDALSRAMTAWRAQDAAAAKEVAAA
jgi:WhiB family redox-sensing transcriptional regulator